MQIRTHALCLNMYILLDARNNLIGDFVNHGGVIDDGNHDGGGNGNGDDNGGGGRSAPFNNYCVI